MQRGRRERNLSVYRWKVYLLLLIYASSVPVRGGGGGGGKDVYPSLLIPHFLPKTNIQPGSGLKSGCISVCVGKVGRANFIWLQSIFFFLFFPPCCSLLLFRSPLLLTYLFLRRITYKPSVKGFMVY